MSDDPTPEEQATDRAPGEPAREKARESAQRRRRLAEIFGEVLPEQTSDDRGEAGGAGRRTEEQAQEDWLRSQVPPHHGS